MKQDCDNVTWVLTKTVLYRFPQGAKEFDLKIGVPGKGSCIAVFGNNKVYVGTESDGLHALVGKRWHWSELMEGVTGILSNNISCLDIDPAGDVWIGTDKGVCVYDDNSYWLDNSKITGLPNGEITGMVTDSEGRRYFTTSCGLIILHNGKLSYYGYKRWLPDMHATGIVLSPDGSFCVSTASGGISVFKTEMMTLEEKAKRLRAFSENTTSARTASCSSARLSMRALCPKMKAMSAPATTTDSGRVFISARCALNTPAQRTRRFAPRLTDRCSR